MARGRNKKFWLNNLPEQKYKKPPIKELGIIKCYLFAIPIKEELDLKNHPFKFILTIISALTILNQNKHLVQSTTADFTFSIKMRLECKQQLNQGNKAPLIPAKKLRKYRPTIRSHTVFTGIGPC